MNKFLRAAALIGFGAIVVSGASMESAAAQVPYSWSGYYFGVNLGASISNTSGSDGVGCGTVSGVNPQYICNTGSDPLSALNAATFTNSFSKFGSNTNFTGGVHGGFNRQNGIVVYGGEFDIGYFNIGAKRSGTGTYPNFGGGGAAIGGDQFAASSSFSSDMLVTLRGRVGYLVTPSLLAYGTGGLAAAGVRGTNNYNDNHDDFGGPPFPTGSNKTNETKFGWTAGAGLEYALGRSWTVRAEYLYVDLGSMSVTSLILPPGHLNEYTPYTSSADLTSHLVRFGVSYKMP